MEDNAPLSRRTVIQWAAASGAALVACSATKDSGLVDTDDTASSGDSGDSGETAGADVAWAVGGTAAMTMKSSYPDPFDAAVKACSLTCETTEGPCTADSVEREDVSEGWTGLPVRLLLRVLDSDCNPVAGATVLIWHTQRSGVYSGETPSGAFCYGDDPEAEEYLYFRGHQITDEDGVVGFDSCFPGWYSSRCPHIHFQVILDGSLYVTSQVVFDDDLCEEIYSSHEEYADFGLPDTTIATDTVVGGVDDPSDYILNVERMADGAMLAWKTITIRSSLSEETCEAEGRTPGRSSRRMPRGWRALWG